MTKAIEDASKKRRETSNTTTEAIVNLNIRFLGTSVTDDLASRKQVFDRSVIKCNRNS